MYTVLFYYYNTCAFYITFHINYNLLLVCSVTCILIYSRHVLLFLRCKNNTHMLGIMLFRGVSE